MPTKIIPISHKQLKSLYEEHTYSELVEITGWSMTTVSRQLKKAGLAGSYRKTMKTRQKYADSKKGRWTGSSNPNWKGGVTEVHYGSENRGSVSAWRKAVKRRDNYICQKCGLDGKIPCPHCNEKPQIHADHIKPWVDYPELRTDVNNGMTLCKKCHRLKTG